MRNGFLLSWFLLSIKSTIASRTFCSVDHAALTCYFNEDLKERGKSFCLYRYNADQEDTPIACNWKESRPSCSVKPGFSPPENVSDEFTIALPPGSAGTYHCDTIPPGPKVTKCRFDESGLQGTSTLPSDDKRETGPKQPETCRCEEEAAKIIAVALSTFLLLSAILFPACYTFNGKYRVSTVACLRKKMSDCHCAVKCSGAVRVKVVQREDGPELEELQPEEMQRAGINTGTEPFSTRVEGFQTEEEVVRE